MRITFPKHNFDYFLRNAPELLDEEIARSAIRMKLQHDPVTPEDRKMYQDELDRLTVLKYINQHKKGKLSLEDFVLKVDLVAEHK